jgi:hypothetical protein
MFRWKRFGAEWRLFHDRRTVARVVPDSKYPGMWRVRLPGGLSDMVNLSRARDAALGFAAWRIGQRQEAAKPRQKTVENQGAFSAPSP